MLNEIGDSEYIDTAFNEIEVAGGHPVFDDEEACLFLRKSEEVASPSGSITES
ncbi:hypothetical protein [Acidovorax carolinensis]|uniref:hypothetical protein n=1 Tax=Acidovorax carolinensis TaxID=553814 RepID=UPI0012FF95B1|nr:hypothetical protein [Acidovorax carolinensis]